MSQPVAARTSWYNETMRSSLIRRVKRLVRKMNWALSGWRSGAHNPNVTGSARTTEVESGDRPKTVRIVATVRPASFRGAFTAGTKKPRKHTNQPSWSRYKKIENPAGSFGRAVN